MSETGECLNSSSRGLKGQRVVDNSGVIRSVMSEFTPGMATMSVTAVADAMYPVAGVDAGAECMFKSASTILSMNWISDLSTVF